MPQTGTYCKAVRLAVLRRFEGWRENADAVRPTETIVDGRPVATRRALQGDDYVFVHDDHVVTDGIFKDQHIIFDAVDDAWKRFCRQTLGLAPPLEVPNDDPRGET